MTKQYRLNESSLKTLRKRYKIIGDKITNLYEANRKIHDDIDKEYIKTIPDELSKISAKQWKFILQHHHGVSGANHEYQRHIFYIHGWNVSMGFYEPVKQVIPMIKSSVIADAKFFEFYEYLLKYLKKPFIIQCFDKEGDMTELTSDVNFKEFIDVFTKA